MSENGQKRKLATIMAMDVAGYSKLMASDEEATLRTLESYREIIDRMVERHDGSIFNTAGDAVLAEFGSAVEAVRCALTIQDELRTRNAELVPERQMHFRIGINVGDVLISGTDRFGDGINVAARLEGIAEPGGVCISGSTFEQVKNKLSIGFTDLGAQQVKNIPEPVAAFGITSAPVSVQGGTEPADGPAQPQAAETAEKPRPIWAWAAAAVIFVAAAAGVGYWQYGSGGPKSLSSYPEKASTTDMNAAEIAEFVAGMRITGKRTADGAEFTILLNPDKTVSYQVAPGGDQAGGNINITGKWWVEDSRFCMKMRGFNSGQNACPNITKDGQKVKLIRRMTGQELPFTVTK